MDALFSNEVSLPLYEQLGADDHQFGLATTVGLFTAHTGCSELESFS